MWDLNDLEWGGGPIEIRRGIDRTLIKDSFIHLTRSRNIRASYFYIIIEKPCFPHLGVFWVPLKWKINFNSTTLTYAYLHMYEYKLKTTKKYI